MNTGNAVFGKFFLSSSFLLFTIWSRWRLTERLRFIMFAVRRFDWWRSTVLRPLRPYHLSFHLGVYSTIDAHAIGLGVGFCNVTVSDILLCFVFFASSTL